jgi:hypothetical protein
VVGSALVGGVEARKQNTTDQYSVIWSVDESDIVSVAADDSRVYLATSNNIRSHDPQTGDAGTIIGSTENIREMVSIDQFIYVMTGSGVEKYSKDSGRIWRRPVEAPTVFTATSSGLFVVGGYKEDQGYGSPEQNAVQIQKIATDGSVQWSTDLNWQLGNDVAVTGDSVLVAGAENSELSSNPHRIRQFDRATGTQTGEITTDDSRLLTSKITITDGAGYALIESGELGIVMRFDPVEMTTVWQNTFSLEIDSTYGPYEFSPTVTDDGVYAYDGSIHLAKYSKVSGERQWSAASIVPHGVTTSDDGILVTGIDDTSVSEEDTNGDGLLVSYSGEGLEQWQLSIGQGSKEGRSFTPPKSLPSVEDAYLIGDLDSRLQLVGSEAVAASFNPTPEPTTEPADGTETQSTVEATTTRAASESGRAQTDTPESMSADAGDDTRPERGFFTNGEGGPFSSVSGSNLTALSTGITVVGIGVTILDMLRGGDD